MNLFSKITIALITLCFLSTNVWALNPNQTLTEDGKIVESFYIDGSEDFIAITSSPEQFLRPFPVGIQFLHEPNLVGGLALLSKIRDRFEEIVGFTAEQEHISVGADGRTTSLSDWTLKVPNRGTILVTQIEDFTPFIDILMEMIANGETERYFDPPFLMETTSPGSGKIVGGVGEFEGATGTFREINWVHYASIENGTLDVDVQLEITFDDQGQNQQ